MPKPLGAAPLSSSAATLTAALHTGQIRTPTAHKRSFQRLQEASTSPKGPKHNMT